MPNPSNPTAAPSRIPQTISTLLTLVGVGGGFYLLQASALPISPLTGADWLILTLATVAIIWAQRVSRTGAWTILSGFFLGLLGVSFFAKAPDSSYAITTWCYGGEQGVIGALLATSFLTRVRLWFLKKTTLRMGFFLLIAIGINLFFGYRQLSMSPSNFGGLSFILLAAGFSAALLLRILRRAIAKKKATPVTSKKIQKKQTPATQPAAKPKSDTPAKHIQPQKKTQPPPTSKKHQKKKNPSPTAHPSSQKTKPAPRPQAAPSTPKPDTQPEPKRTPQTTPPMIAEPTPLVTPKVQPAAPKPAPPKDEPFVIPRASLTPKKETPVIAPEPAQETQPPVQPKKPQPNIAAPNPAPNSPAKQDDLNSAYDLLDRIKKKQ